MEYSLGQSRGGTPIDVRILLDARPCQQHGTRINASVGVPLPYLFGEVSVADSEKTGTTPFFSRRLLSSHFKRSGILQNSDAQALRERARSSSPVFTGEDETSQNRLADFAFWLSKSADQAGSPFR
jgi:hypothetical protein